MEEIKSSADWNKEPKYEEIVIMDPDGWDRKNYKESWKELITRTEFEKRMSLSTCSYPAGFFKSV